ncbi:MAG: tRNA uridine-5-carboxymethylaminomethyl(34) synthesis enzyme MnmG [Bacteroidia bacterium]
MKNSYDVIVVGAGHAGCEAAASAANMGSKVLLITMSMQTIAQMSCNPAMGGIAKGQIVREIDALGGYSGIVSDNSAIQFRMLNLSKGPAMWSPRCQSDRMRFAEEWRLRLENTPNVDFWQDMVGEIIVENDKVVGVKTSLGIEFHSKAVVLTNGTFLNGVIHIGEKQLGGGRSGEKASTGITEQLISFGFDSGRMKTGTPPRIDGRSLDYSFMEEQAGDENPGKFSFTNTKPLIKQLSCWITYTNDEVHDILKTGFDKSPMYQGRIQGLGPRYCPSIEDKITRFAERNRHQLFIEPEGWNTVEIYLNGFSTSLPMEVQQKALEKIPGFKNAKMFRPGYAIEYDYFPPTQLDLTLQTNKIENLYFAGQINGTTGYEEAACQGFMAGINSHLKINSLPPFILSRSDAYIGVLIDDLVTKGTDEPYRMFTSRAEYRILLRQDNADIRLTQKGFELGLISGERYIAFQEKRANITTIVKTVKETSVSPEEMNTNLVSVGSAPIVQKVKAASILSRPNVSLKEFANADVYSSINVFSIEEQEQAEIEIKYNSYIQKEQDAAIKQSQTENIKIRSDIDFKNIVSLSSEAKDKFTKIKPQTIGQAARISGISPADISVLMIHMGR